MLLSLCNGTDVNRNLESETGQKVINNTTGTITSLGAHGNNGIFGPRPCHHFVTNLVDLSPSFSPLPSVTGMSVLSVITFQDDVDYLDSLGKTQVADVKRSADIGVAEAERDAGIREAEYERGCQDKRFQADTSIAGKNHTVRVFVVFYQQLKQDLA